MDCQLDDVLASLAACYLIYLLSSLYCNIVFCLLHADKKILID